MADMVGKLCSLSKGRVILSFAPNTWYYSLLKKVRHEPSACERTGSISNHGRGMLTARAGSHILFDRLHRDIPPGTIANASFFLPSLPSPGGRAVPGPLKDDAGVPPHGGVG